MKNKIEGVGTQTHYAAHGIEPIDYIVSNGMNFLEGNVIKYVTRYKLKNGLEDLKKAQQYLQWLHDEVAAREKADANVGSLIPCADGESIQNCAKRVQESTGCFGYKEEN